MKQLGTRSHRHPKDLEGKWKEETLPEPRSKGSVCQGLESWLAELVSTGEAAIA